MGNNQIDATLFCVNCDEETNHKVDYRGDRIHSVTCTQCGMTVQMDQDYIDDNFTQDFVKRVFTKPSRLTKEMQADLNAFMRILPYRVITKPYRVYREINEHKND